MINTILSAVLPTIILTGETSSIFAPLKNLVSLLLSGVSIWGIILVIKNISAIAAAYKDQDDNGISAGVKGLIGGLMLAGITGVLAFLGISI